MDSLSVMGKLSAAVRGKPRIVAPATLGEAGKKPGGCRTWKCNHTREKLVEAASLLFWKRSYLGVSVDDICAEAGVKKGSFYHFFGSKADLMLATMDRDWEEFQAELDKVFSPQRSPEQRLAVFCAHVVRRQTEFREQYGVLMGCPCANIGGEMSLQDEAIRIKAEEMLKRFSIYFSSLIRDAQALGEVAADVDAERVSLQMWASCMGLMIQARIMDNLDVLARELPVVLARFLGKDGLPAAQEV